MTRRLLALLAALSALMAVSGASAAGGLGFIPKLPAGWTHAQINVVIGRQPHTLTYDRGRVQSVTPTSLTLRESDGSIVTISLDPTTRVTIDGSPGSIDQIRPREVATTLSVDGAPASLVRIAVPPRLAAALARRGGALR